MYEIKEIDKAFRMYDEDVEIGFIEYTGADIIIIASTFIDEKYKGQGLAGELVKAIIFKAIDEDRKIIPLCPYAKNWFEKNSEYNYLLKE